MSTPNDWEFCARAICPNRTRVSEVRDRVFARHWLWSLQADGARMREMRDLVAARHPANLALMANADIVAQVSELLVAGRVHVHARVAREVLPSQVFSQPATPEVVFAPPKPPRPITASRPAIDAPTFGPGVDLDAQAGALVAAAQSGSPFCPL